MNELASSATNDNVYVQSAWIFAIDPEQPHTEINLLAFVEMIEPQIRHPGGLEGGKINGRSKSIFHGWVLFFRTSRPPPLPLKLPAMEEVL